MWSLIQNLINTILSFFSPGKAPQTIPNKTPSLESPKTLHLPEPKKKQLGIDFEPIFDFVCDSIGVPKRILVTIVRTEQNRMNGFNTFAFNEESQADIKKGRDINSVGLAQILYPDTAHDFMPGIPLERLYDPETNLKIAAMKIRRDIKRYGYDENFPEKVIAAYNAGSYIIKEGKLINQQYVDRARSFWNAY